ncbi:MAG: hypothetical protein ACLUPG_19150 [Roseburia faecis]
MRFPGLFDRAIDYFKILRDGQNLGRAPHAAAAGGRHGAQDAADVQDHCRKAARVMCRKEKEEDGV